MTPSVSLILFTDSFLVGDLRFLLLPSPNTAYSPLPQLYKSCAANQYVNKRDKKVAKIHLEEMRGIFMCNILNNKG